MISIKKTFQTNLLTWHQQHGRKNLPWQTLNNPYSTWLSEIMLQQTQVNTVIPYFNQFIKAFPNIILLANAPLDHVLHLWTGLGYYARARNLHASAILIRQRYKGRFPSNYEELMNLPGIGRSTAGAILSLAFKKAYPILDGNVKRVFTRYFAITGWPEQSSIKKTLWDHAEQLLSKDKPHHYNQALMDLGALICTQKKPNCQQCPLNKKCLAYQQQLTHQLPTPKPKKNKPKKTTHFLILHSRSHRLIYLEKRPEQKLWQNLWTFPEVATKKMMLIWVTKHFPTLKYMTKTLDSFVHHFSHYDLLIHPLLIELQSTPLPPFTKLANTLWYPYFSPPKIGLCKPTLELIKTIRNP